LSPEADTTGSSEAHEFVLRFLISLNEIMPDALRLAGYDRENETTAKSNMIAVSDDADGVFQPCLFCTLGCCQFNINEVFVTLANSV
jgi:hypothetical protein